MVLSQGTLTRKSKKMVKYNDTVKADMEESFKETEQEVELSLESLTAKFDDARKYYDALSESRLKADALNLLD